MTRKQANYYFIRGYMEKKAQTAYDNSGTTLSLQKFMPIRKRRKLTRDEESEIERKSKRFFPKIWRSNSTPLTDLVSSPGKAAIIPAISAPLLGAASGAYINFVRKALGEPKPSGSISDVAIGTGVGLLAAPLLGALGYYGKRQQNENITDNLRRLPVGATVRDMKSDPVYQREREQAVQAIRATTRYGMF